MRSIQYKTGAVAALAAVAVIGLSATSAAAPMTNAQAPGPADPAAELVGPVCSSYAK